MTTFPGSPKVQKGAIIGLDPANPVASVIVFQYNPDTLTRSLTVQTTSDSDSSRGEALRLKGPPEETISLDIEIDAVDQLEKGDSNAISIGIYPALLALEMLLYPKSALVIANEVLATIGIIEIIPPEAPLMLFVWGAKCVLPVRLTSFSITKQALDPNLNPIQAKVSLGMRVLNYMDLGLPSVGGALFMAQQVACNNPINLTSIDDGPESNYPLIEFNILNGKNNFLREAHLEFLFATVFTVQRPDGSFRHPRSIYWNMRWHHRFTLINFAAPGVAASWTVPTNLEDTGANFSGTIKGAPTTDPRVPIFTVPQPSNCNTMGG